MRYLVLFLMVLCLSTPAMAAFGGARGGGGGGGGRSSFSSSSSSSRSSGSSFGGSRSSGSSAPAPSSKPSSSFGGQRATTNAPIERPAPVTNGAKPTTYAQPTQTVVVHHDSGGGFWSGLFLGSALNRPQVVVAGGGQPVVYESGSGSVFWTIIALSIIALIAIAIWSNWKGSNRD